jgi:hypothetical protein
MLMGAGGHENPRTLSLYVKPEPEAVASALAHQDPAAPLTGPRTRQSGQASLLRIQATMAM